MSAGPSTLSLLPSRLRIICGLIVGVYVTFHLLNHALGLISLATQEAVRPWVMALWHSPPGQVLLYGSLLVHAAMGLWAIVRRRTFRLARWELCQILSGVAIPYLLLVHIVNTRGTRLLANIDITYPYEIANLWVNPLTRAMQVILVLLVWTHFAMGLHFAMRFRPAYQRWFVPAMLFYVLAPLGALLGFAEVGMQMTARANADPLWYSEIRARGTPRDQTNAALRSALKAHAGDLWLALAGLTFAGALVRNRLAATRCLTITYPPAQRVRVPLGMSILEASRFAGRPHMSVCGGRARCTTCRVRVVSTAQVLPAPNPAELRALAHLQAPAGVRLACQLRPTGDLRIEPLLNPTLLFAASTRWGGSQFGQERPVTVLFLDVRGSTQLAETRMPYDVVFVLNHFFEEMAMAVEEAGGHYSNFTGDGLMALFGLDARDDHGASAALRCAHSMLQRLDRINQQLAGELLKPLAIGIGIHSGVAIIGRMGPPKTPVLTALGDTVNTAARLESATKDLHAHAVISISTLRLAQAPPVPTSLLHVRGRKDEVEVAALDEAQLAEMLAVIR